MRKFTKIALTTALALGLAAATHAQVSYTGGTYNQDFDTLVNTGTSSTAPLGWAFAEGGSGANTIYTASTGSLTTGDTYSFGATLAADRAFGGLQSGTVIPTIGGSFTNNTGTTITDLAIAYFGEQWRLGTSGRADQLDFQFSTNATSLTTGTWIDLNALDFVAPISVGTVGALDGNLSANRVSVSSTISGLSLADGSTIWIRWNSFDASGADDGLGIDGFSLAAVPEPSVYMLLGVGILLCGQRFMRRGKSA